MKKLSLIALSLLVMGISAAHADWNGNWQGTFNTIDNKGDTTGTPGFTLSVTSTGTAIQFAEPAGLTVLSSLSLASSNGVLSLNGHAVGTYDANNIAFTLLNDIDGLFIRVAAVLNADGSVALTYDVADYQGDFLNGSSSLTVVSKSVQTSRAPESLMDLFKSLEK